MENEILRFSRVTYEKDSVVYLRDFELDIQKGEIMGLIPLNAYGLEEFLELLKSNDPLYYGYVYYNGKKVNSWQDMHRAPNKITVIGSENSLVMGQSVVSNIFVLREGFGQYIIRNSLLEDQLRPFLQDIGEDIDPGSRVEELSAYERVLVEILRAVIAGNRLIVLRELGTFIAENEMGRLYEVVRHYSKRGIAFLFISGHLEEISSLCSRAAVMSGGRILNIISSDKLAGSIWDALYQEHSDYAGQGAGRPGRALSEKEVLEIRDLKLALGARLTVTVRKGEYLVIRPLDNRVFDDLISAIFGDYKPADSRFYIEGDKTVLCRDRRVALLREHPEENMLFEELSYLDNLLFTVDHRIPSVWGRSGVARSVRQELSGLLGEEVFGKSIRELTQKEKIELIYGRILLQKPDLVLCAMPFKDEDFSMRLLLKELQEMLLARGISIVNITMNVADSAPLADRIIEIAAICN
ncbi:ATP-binding cassette domain-containing protein [Butyrivibrio sp. MC2013]|uniref:ATP-binding cassette domain-containing protein n=1 Tax=Butyrivibrio sp. MC2013 TaxID=1280686 RepID=UPI0003F58DE0|nr:ATP-binding cassette domain-containing protein [Butyrivibrio sp. MC2013]